MCIIYPTLSAFKYNELVSRYFIIIYFFYHKTDICTILCFNLNLLLRKAVVAVSKSIFSFGFNAWVTKTMLFYLFQKYNLYMRTFLVDIKKALFAY